MISPAIENAYSITEVVEIVNAANRDEAIAYYGGTELRDGDQLAGHYAYDAAKNAGYGMEEADFEAHLEFLRDAGAVFNSTKAVAEAVWLTKQSVE
ncbi:hypothetical protein [Rheinheimera sp. NSM]|uniref:hypothetical protein n=1 Tax=Rheinheimera sp. NSM TaxID=3457884 RepID=UPI004036E7E3